MNIAGKLARTGLFILAGCFVGGCHSSSDNDSGPAVSEVEDFSGDPNTGAGTGNDDVRTISITELGGLIGIGMEEGEGAYAEFFSATVPAVTMKMDGLVDTCHEVFSLFSVDLYEVAFTYLDVGSEVTFTNGSTTITAAIVERELEDEEGALAYASEGIVPPGTYDVTVAGTHSISGGAVGKVTAPARAVLTGTPSVVAGTALDVEWTGGEGANLIGINLGHWDCVVANDGFFQIPANVTTAVGTGRTVEIEAVSMGTFAFQGREVLAIGMFQSELDEPVPDSGPNLVACVSQPNGWHCCVNVGTDDSYESTCYRCDMNMRGCCDNQGTCYVCDPDEGFCCDDGGTCFEAPFLSSEKLP